VSVQEHAMPRLRASEWIVPPIAIPLFLMLPVAAAAQFHG